MSTLTTRVVLKHKPKVHVLRPVHAGYPNGRKELVVREVIGALPIAGTWAAETSLGGFLYPYQYGIEWWLPVDDPVEDALDYLLNPKPSVITEVSPCSWLSVPQTPQPLRDWSERWTSERKMERASVLLMT